MNINLILIIIIIIGQNLISFVGTKMFNIHQNLTKKFIKLQQFVKVSKAQYITVKIVDN